MQTIILGRHTMKTITNYTEKDFIAALKTATITPTEVDYVETNTVEARGPDEFDIDWDWGWIWSTLTIDGGTVQYTEQYEHPSHHPSEARTIEYHDGGYGTPWHWGDWNIAVIDEDGDELDRDEVAALIIKHTDIDCFDLSIFGDDETEDIDMSEDNDAADVITLYRDNDYDLRFRGALVAEASSRPYGNQPNYGRWNVLALYRSVGGKYICQKICRTQHDGERDRYAAAVCETNADVIEYFGTGSLAKEIYTAANIECVEDVH